jgi:ribosomal subunit interface protein
MKVEVVGHGFNLGESLKTHIEENLISHVNKYFTHAVSGKVTLSKERKMFHVDVIVNEGVLHGPFIKATSQEYDAYEAADSAIFKIATKLRRYKRKLKDHKSATMINFKSSLLNKEYDQNSTAKAVVIEEEKMDIRTLSLEDAVMYLDLMSVQAFIFINIETNKLNIIYKRDNGNLVLVDTNQSFNGN